MNCIHDECPPLLNLAVTKSLTQLRGKKKKKKKKKPPGGAKIISELLYD